MLIITNSISSQFFSMPKTTTTKKTKKVSYDKKNSVQVQKTIDFNVSPRIISQILVIVC